MKKLIEKLFADEDGAISVDFVVLTAAICLLGFSVVNAFSGSAVELANESASFMQEQCVNLACN